MATDGESVFIGLDAAQTVDRYELDLTADAWGAAYNHNADILAMWADYDFVYVGGHDPAGGGVDHLVALNRTTGTVAWTSTNLVPGGVDGRVQSIRSDGRFVYVAAFDASGGDGYLLKFSRVSGDLIISMPIEPTSSRNPNGVTVDGSIVAVSCLNNSPNENLYIYDKRDLSLIASEDVTNIAAKSPNVIDSDGSRLYLGLEAGSLNGDLVNVSRSTAPSTWVAEDVAQRGRRYLNVLSPGER